LFLNVGKLCLKIVSIDAVTTLGYVQNNSDLLSLLKHQTASEVILAILFTGTVVIA